MNIYAKFGDQVQFNYPNNGNKYDKETAKKYMNVGVVFTIDYTVVGDWHTDVYLQEVPEVAFNSVMFDDYPVIERKE